MNSSPETKPGFSISSGDVFLLGNHRLACGSTSDHALLGRLLDSAKIDLILTDPPYGVAYVSSKMGVTDGVSNPKEILNDHEQSDAEYRAFTKDWLLAVRPHLAKKNAAYIFNSDKMVFALREGMLEAGFKFAQLLIWVKDHAVLGRMDYLPQHELIAYGWYGTHAFQRSKAKSVLAFPKPGKSPHHPTQKPIGLLRELILNSSKPNDAVFDGFLGGGSTLLACEQTRRRCYGVEIDTEHCLTIIRRWEALTGQKAVKT
jgi:DNA modification methylase